MKKIVLTTVCAMAIASGAFAQGNVNWGSISFAFVTEQTNSTAYSPLFGGGTPAASGAIGFLAGSTTTAGQGYYFELLNTSFSGTQATIPSISALLTWSDAGLSATNNSLNASGRLAVVNANAAAQVPWSPGTTDSIVLVGWSANLGTTWGAVSNMLAHWTTDAIGNAFLGITATGYTTTAPTASNPGATLFGAATAQGLPITGSTGTSLYLLPSVPEPATMALAGLGGLSLLLFRRQRK